ncbi:MAG: pyridoxal-phosphate dependent enzyme [Bradymonadia bacterium]
MMTGAVADVSQAIGHTPLVRLNRLTAGLKANIYCKLGYLNPGGSVKDRIALNIINEAEKRGDLKPGGTIVEATSGNTGMGLAMIGALRGYKCVFVMPDKQSMEKVKALRAAGAKVVITPTNVEPEDPRSYYSVSRRIADETPNAFYANQYHNKDNTEAHYISTGPEIWDQTGGEVDVFVAGLGTGGTITGTGRYLKEQKEDVQLVGVDCRGSIYYDFWKSGEVIQPYSYKVEGIGEDFFPSTINLSIIDDIVQLTDKECFDATRALARQEGIYTGGSGGAAVLGAIRYAEKIDRECNIVVLLPDSASRYLNKIFDDEWMRENGFLDPEANLGTIRDLLANKPADVMTVEKTAKVSDVIELMKRAGISQVPVIERGHLAGIVNESALLEMLLENGMAALDAPVSTVASDAYEVADPDAPVGLFNHIFGQGKVIVVWERGEVRGLITQIDVIDYLAHRRKI